MDTDNRNTENTRRTGARMELVAGEYLNQAGYVILERNFRCHSGEIDLIAKEGGYLVFVEVKFRKNGDCGYPEDAVNYKKQRQISKVALYYLKRQQYSFDTPCRFDVVAVTPQEIRLYKNAFEFVF